MLLANKKIVLVISGGIAAFKAAALASLLGKEGAVVKCVMTQHATAFITPLTLREITGNPVAVDMFGDTFEFNIEHIALARWADAFVVVPATANIIGKIANGIADDLATTTLMATKAPVMIAPAMNSNMYLNPVVQGNLQKLKALGYVIAEPDRGRLACGIDGVGRLPDPDILVEYIEKTTCSSALLRGKKVLVTAGGTRERIDPVRYIGNRSSGRMGFAVAKAAMLAGADVTLVAAPSALPAPLGVHRIDVGTTLEMQAACEEIYDSVDLVVKAAAVADYRVARPAENKIKKSSETLTVELAKNPDILYGLGQKKTHQVLIGFAAETTNVIEYGMGKLKKKNLDMLVANDVSVAGAGFQGTTNIATFLFPDGRSEAMEMMSKFELAQKIISAGAALVAAKESAEA